MKYMAASRGKSELYFVLIKNALKKTFRVRMHIFENK